jgi:hypothetical protein
VARALRALADAKTALALQLPVRSARATSRQTDKHRSLPHQYGSLKVHAILSNLELSQPERTAGLGTRKESSSFLLSCVQNKNAISKRYCGNGCRIIVSRPHASACATSNLTYPDT